MGNFASFAISLALRFVARTSADCLSGANREGYRGRVASPSFDGATEWLNSEPLGPAELRGHVVVANFWTLTCINWLRQEPYVRAWAKAYKDDGLIVVGVHTPEFTFEQETPRIRQAIEQYEIDYPVAVDSDYGVWNGFSNHYWPALYFLDREGVVRDEHFGEGRYEASERVIQKLLGIERDPVPVQGVGVEAEADWGTLRTPETYLGFRRAERFADNARYDERSTYRPAPHLSLNHWGLAGEWTVGPEAVTAEQAGASISFRFEARDVHLVLSRSAAAPVPFRVTIDGEAPGPSHGTDVDADGNGMLDAGRLYQLIREVGEVRERTIEITFLEPGAETYAFTFG
jgi:thiol-disulfide isomerase/thioredoxin